MSHAVVPGTAFNGFQVVSQAANKEEDVTFLMVLVGVFWLAIMWGLISVFISMIDGIINYVCPKEKPEIANTSFSVEASKDNKLCRSDNLSPDDHGLRLDDNSRFPDNDSSSDYAASIDGNATPSSDTDDEALMTPSGSGNINGVSIDGPKDVVVTLRMAEAIVGENFRVSLTFCKDNIRIAEHSSTTAALKHD